MIQSDINLQSLYERHYYQLLDAGFVIKIKKNDVEKLCSLQDFILAAIKNGTVVLLKADEKGDIIRRYENVNIGWSEHENLY